LFDVVPALKLMLPWVLATVADAVTTLPFSPNVILLPFAKVSALRLLLVVPALTLMLLRLDATLAVKVPAFNPKETLLPFENEI
jgi:hypothetical protein